MKRVGQIDLFTKRVRSAIRTPIERQIHIAVADTLDKGGLAPGWMWWHCPNGELRTDATGALLQRMGVKPGVSDIHLLDPHGRFYALELKRKGKKPTDAQLLWMAEVGKRQECRVAWTDSYDGAMAILRGWGAIHSRWQG
jgi:hypothetical protein